MGAQVWVVGSGKGGIGKTLISSNLAIAMSRLNKSVLVVDFDLTGGNVHTCFGLQPQSEKSLRSFLEGSVKLNEIQIPTGIPRVSFVQGFWDDWSLHGVTLEQTHRLFEAMKASAFDVVIVDLGTGTGPTNMEMLKLADEKIVIVDAEPTSVEKLYRYMEAFICHFLKENATSEALLKIHSALREYRREHKSPMQSFRTHLENATGFSIAHFEDLEHSAIHLIVNSCRARSDYDLGPAIKSVCARYFDLGINYLGALDYDNAVWQSARSKEPVLAGKPFTALSTQFLILVKGLLQSQTERNLSANQFKTVV